MHEAIRFGYSSAMTIRCESGTSQTRNGKVRGLRRAFCGVSTGAPRSEGFSLGKYPRLWMQTTLGAIRWEIYSSLYPLIWLVTKGGTWFA